MGERVQPRKFVILKWVMQASFMYDRYKVVNAWFLNFILDIHPDNPYPYPFILLS